MYECLDCKKIFDKPKIISEESYYGVGDLFDNSYSNVEICPYCDGDIKEHEEEEEENAE